MKLSHLPVLLVASAPALSAHKVPESYNYVGIHATQHTFDIGGHVPNPDLEDGWLPGLQAGVRKDNWSLQAWWEDGELDIEDATGELSLRSIFASIRHHYHNENVIGFEPYTGFTVGDKRFEPDTGDSDNETAVGFEMGLQKGFARRWVLDLGVRPSYSTDNERWDGQAYVALNLAFGTGSSTRSDESTASSNTADSDTAAYRQAEPAASAASPESTADDDGDGVSNSEDACPDTTAGARVDDKGCHQMLTESVRQTLYIQFETGKAVVSERSYGDLERIATMMREYPETSLVLEGHTDSQGSAALNKRLSQERADAARTVLVERFGIDGSRITAVGRGEEQPVASNDTAAGRARNRRVETILEASRPVAP